MPFKPRRITLLAITPFEEQLYANQPPEWVRELRNLALGVVTHYTPIPASQPLGKAFTFDSQPLEASPITEAVPPPPDQPITSDLALLPPETDPCLKAS